MMDHEFCVMLAMVGGVGAGALFGYVWAVLVMSARRQ